MVKNLELVEQAIAEIQNKKYTDENLQSIKRILNRELKANCSTIYIVQNNTSNYFFGMHVFPSRQEQKRLANVLIADQKKEVKMENLREVVIEIDSKLLYELGATPREIVSVLLHEIGHNVYTNRHQARMKGLYAIKASQLGATTVGLVTQAAVPALVTLFILGCFESSFAYVSGLQSEIEADSFAVQCGYGKDLHSVITRLQNMNSRKEISLLTNRRESEEASVQWTLKQSNDFRMRKKEIERQLKAQEEIEVSLVGKWAIQDALDDFKQKMNINKNIKTKIGIQNESLKSYIDMKRNGISHLEFREIEVEIQKINDYEDKLYLISRIFKAIKEVDRIIYLYEHTDEKTTDQEKKKMKGISYKDAKEYRKALNVLLDEVRNKKVRPKLTTQVEINVAYPKGYEG